MTKSATEQKTKRGDLTAEREGEQNENRREREKALTVLSMSAVRAGLGPGARLLRLQRGLPGVADHASITMSQVGQAAKMSNKCNRAPLLTDFTAPIRLSSPSLCVTLPPSCCTYALLLPLTLSEALALSPTHLSYVHSTDPVTLPSYIDIHALNV